MILRNIILFFNILLITACSLNQNYVHDTKNQKTQPASLLEFCKSKGGEFKIIKDVEIMQDITTCITPTGICTSTQYIENKCENLDQCMNKPAQCYLGAEGRSPDYCMNGKIIPIRDACGCAGGTICQGN